MRFLNKNDSRFKVRRNFNSWSHVTVSKGLVTVNSGTSNMISLIDFQPFLLSKFNLIFEEVTSY